ncbi:hypothetical protein KY284_029951 [Solanum tuberosum]|nr:hypothetical protein KY284_029951 [Solanum tuberosum]
MEKLTKFRDAMKEKVDGTEREGYKPKPDVLKWLKVEGVEREGYKPKPDVLKWLKDVQKLENEWESIQESIAMTKKLA